MDRQKAMEKQRQYAINKNLRELFEILEPGEVTKWGTKKHTDLVAYGAIHLAMEYQALTGQPIIDMMQEPLSKLELSVPPPTPEVKEGDALPL